MDELIVYAGLATETERDADASEERDVSTGIALSFIHTIFDVIRRIPNQSERRMLIGRSCHLTMQIFVEVVVQID